MDSDRFLSSRWEMSLLRVFRNSFRFDLIDVHSFWETGRWSGSILCVENMRAGSTIIEVARSSNLDTVQNVFHDFKDECEWTHSYWVQLGPKQATLAAPSAVLDPDASPLQWPELGRPFAWRHESSCLEPYKNMKVLLSLLVISVYELANVNYIHNDLSW